MLHGWLIDVAYLTYCIDALGCGRYLLVGFCHTTPAAAQTPGNLTLELQHIQPPQLDPIAGTFTDAVTVTAELLADAHKLYDMAGGRSFWLAADAEPRNYIESVAEEVFKFQQAQLPVGTVVAGAEVWVQACSGGQGIG